MKASQAELETVLRTAYAAEADLYTQALSVAQEIATALEERSGTDHSMPKLLALLDQVTGIEARIADAKALWRRNGHRPGEELQSLLVAVRERIEQLARCINRAEQEAAAHRDRLLPELDATVRSQQMQRAYGTAMRSLAGSE